MKQYNLEQRERELINNNGTGIVQDFKGYVEGVLIDNTSWYTSADFINHSLKNDRGLKDTKELIEIYVSCLDKCYSKQLDFSLNDIESEVYNKVNDDDHKTEYYYMEPFYEALGEL